MTTGQRVAGATILAVLAACLWLAWNTFKSPVRPSVGGDRGSLAITSVDLSDGARDVVLSARAMIPGDEATVAVAIVNSGSEAMTYSMTSGLAAPSDASLSTALLLVVRSVGSSCAVFDGEILYDGTLDEAAIASADAGRSLAAASAEVLCFRSVLPGDTGNEAQGREATITLAFTTSDGAVTP